MHLNAEGTLDILLWQNRGLTAPTSLDQVCEGARGGGKTTYALLKAAQMEGLTGPHFSGVLLRQEYQGTVDIIRTSRIVYEILYSGEAKFNQGSGIWTFPSGGTFEINQAASDRDVTKYIGRNFNLVAADQCELWPNMDHINLVMSSMRTAPGIPSMCLWLMNPGGVGHSYCKKRWINHAEPGEVGSDGINGRPFLRLQSSFRENPYIQDNYQQILEAATIHDEVKRQAWIDGSWDIAAGGYFASVWNPKMHVVRIELKDIYRQHFKRFFLAHDFGSSAPSCTLLIGECVGATVAGRYMAPGSFVVLDEISTDDPDNPALGLQWSIDRIAEAIKEMWLRWNIGGRPHGYADDAIFAITDGSAIQAINNQFARCGVTFHRSGKGRRGPGWALLREYLGNSGKPDVPGIYIASRCRYLIDTLPSAPRCPRDPEDIDGRWKLDHALDSLRYGILHKPQIVRFGTTIG